MKDGAPSTEPCPSPSPPEDGGPELARETRELREGEFDICELEDEIAEPGIEDPRDVWAAEGDAVAPPVVREVDTDNE